MDDLGIVDFVATAVAGVAITIMGWWLRSVLIETRVRRARRGGAVSVPVRVGIDGRLRRARLFGAGDQVLVRSWRGGWVVPRSDAPTVRTFREQDFGDGEMDSTIYRDRSGRGITIAVDTPLTPAVAGLHRAPVRRRPVATLPGWVGFAAGTTAAVFALLFALLSYDAVGTVQEVRGDDSCLVSWTHDGARRQTEVDCWLGDGEVAQVGDQIDINAQPAPFADQAVSGPRSDEVWMGMTAFGAGGLWLLAAVFRARWPRNPDLLTADISEAAELDVYRATGPDDLTDLRVLAGQLAAAQGAPQKGVPGLRAHRIIDDIPGAAALTRGLTFVFIAWVAAAVALDAVSDLASLLLVAVAVLLTASYLIRLLRGVRRIRALWASPVRSEWDGYAMPGPWADEWVVLLYAGEQPGWLVTVAEQPDLRSRWMLRGEPTHELVHLVSPVGGVYPGYAVRLDQRLVESVREDVTAALADPEPV